MSMQVTPGFGTFIATREKGNAHHQEIVTHSDHAISKATPTLVEGGVYNNGDVIGNEIDAQKDAQDNFRVAIQPRVI